MSVLKLRNYNLTEPAVRLLRCCTIAIAIRGGGGKMKSVQQQNSHFSLLSSIRFERHASFFPAELESASSTFLPSSLPCSHAEIIKVHGWKHFGSANVGSSILFTKFISFNNQQEHHRCKDPCLHEHHLCHGVICFLVSFVS